MKEKFISVTPNIKILSSKIKFKTSKSSGPGGQNINKLETKAELIFNINDLENISDKNLKELITNLHSKLDKSGNLRIISQSSRSQWKNKQIAIDKLIKILESASVPAKARVPTKRTCTSNDMRLRNKKIRSEKKKLRGKIFV